MFIWFIISFLVNHARSCTYIRSCNQNIWLCMHLDMTFLMINITYLFYSRFDHTQCSSLQGKDTLAFAPFGHGRRKCPGYIFTYVEVSIFLTILLQQFSIKPVGEAKDVEKMYGFVTTPKNPLKYRIRPVENNSL